MIRLIVYFILCFSVRAARKAAQTKRRDKVSSFHDLPDRPHAPLRGLSRRYALLYRFSQKTLIACFLVAATCYEAGASPAPDSAPVVRLDTESQTALRLSETSPAAKSFVPEAPAQEGQYRLGDIDFRLRTKGQKEWKDFSTASRRAAVNPLAPSEAVFAAADLTPSLPSDFPLALRREWRLEGSGLIMRFTLRNVTGKPVEIGGLGIALVFANNLSGQSLADAHTDNVFYDPYIGLDAGYLQVIRLNGSGPVLLVVPEDGTPFEEYKPIPQADFTDDGDNRKCAPRPLHDCTEIGTTNEGSYQWMVHSAGYAADWPEDGAWNPRTLLVLKPGESKSFGLQFVFAPDIRSIEKTLAETGLPVAVGLPGYVIPQGHTSSLFLNARSEVASIRATPAGALDVERNTGAREAKRYKITGRKWGRARLTISYTDGRRQTVHYFVTKPAEQIVDDLGNFLFNRQWFDEPDAPFNRSPSIMSFDRDADDIVRQDDRVWIAGLSDEGGAGAWVAAISKQLIAPNPAEIRKFERFYTETLEGSIQFTDGPTKFGVAKSLFWYDPAEAPDFDYDTALDWNTWSAWNRAHTASDARSFNYVHVALTQWVLYRLSRNYDGLVSSHDWQWYLDHAYHTSMAMVRRAPRYAMHGQMEGDVFVEILKDLRREGMTEQANALESMMRARTEHWKSQPYPFGSEMPWDSTGQAEVHAWLREFGYDEQADATREVILAYDPTIAHWGYNGSARRYWDFLFAGKTRRIERQLHHYGSALNAIPLFNDYRRNPEDMHLLRVAYGGLMGTLTNIDEEGFGAAAFHSMPDMRRFDAYTGDYGMGFFGHALSTASYLLEHETFGWIGFGGDVTTASGTVTLFPNDTGRKRVFIPSANLWLTLDAGKFEAITLHHDTCEVDVRLAAEGAFSKFARLRVESTGGGVCAGMRLDGHSFEREAWTVPFQDGRATISLRPDQE